MAGHADRHGDDLRVMTVGPYLAVETPASCPPSGLRILEWDGAPVAHPPTAIARVSPGEDSSSRTTLHVFSAGRGERPKTVSIRIDPSETEGVRRSCEVCPADSGVLALLRTGVLIFDEAATSTDGKHLQAIRSALAADYVQVDYAVDVATIVEGRIYIDGWIENGSTLGMFLMSTDASVLVPAEDIVFKKRMDVTALIEARGHSVITHNHGFCAAAFLPLDRHPERINLYSAAGDGYAIVGSFLLDRSIPPAAILSRFWEAFGDGGLPTPRFGIDFIAPLIERPAGTTRTFSTIELKPSPVKPRLSIIVPLYGEPFFVRSLLAMQQFMPADYEWIFVCDDARIASVVSDLMRRRTSFLRARTLLVFNHENYGYAPSNNIGVLNATADTLLFMNSDIWIRSPRALETALTELAAGRWSLLGFHLHFEDGSSQHRAMTFVRNPDYGNLYLAEHPAKGLPSSVSDTDPIVPALAVTGALFMVRRAVYNEAGGFNEVFIKGDFEDADLCLRLVSQGKRIGVVPTTECFHLERQSIRTIGSMTTRTVVTYCNCVTFNTLWAGFLDQVEATRQDQRAA